MVVGVSRHNMFPVTTYRRKNHLRKLRSSSRSSENDNRCSVSDQRTPPALDTLAGGVLDPSNPMICIVRMSLLGEYKTATAAHAKAVSELHKKIGVSSKPEYEVLRSGAEAARHEAATAFEALEHHLSEHGCDQEPIVD